MRRVGIHFWLLECYALILALVQMAGGVHTDEAKYLLSIPYPHPPLLRDLFASTALLPGHEFFWRFVIASLATQSVWLLLDLGYVLSPLRRKVLVCSWLLSSAVILQAGTVMIAVLTGVFGLLCVTLALRPKPIARSSAPLIGCLWFFALFSSYQSVLFAPLLLGVLRSGHVSWRKVLLFLGLPLLLLAIYTLTNPMALASMLKVGSQDAVLPLTARFSQVLWICTLAGSGLLTIVGLFGILTSGRMDFLATLLLLVLYIFISSQTYYALLLTPILVAGLMSLLLRRKISGQLFLPMHLILTAVLVFKAFPDMHPTSARSTMRFLHDHAITGLVLIDGPFGHEWQYESAGPIGRFTQTLSSSVEDTAQALVCTKKTCEEDFGDEWVRMEGAPTEVWVRK